ncbi:MAG: High-molecular-weight cytochrome c subunit B [Candidatus Desulfovibrio kirbyi]|uniref:High-molecular-weight cytochrome c subunit B n=1 Tax=Candidatus Desulfovibrio kirbyi TaxID=2696086 RepID=A0A6L2R6F4_9BACT|nr:MAG: High-molecular-weight cytochrome c subunit B [Candidatus Desulfovibrio kirbyi]
MNRRKFLSILGSAGVVSALSTAREAKAGGTHSFPYYEGSYGVLHDTTRCIGCRQCEAACNQVNNLPKPQKSFDDLSVCATRRRTSAREWTVVNKYVVHGKPVFRKLQCFHCNDPACAAACFAKCFQKQPDGSVAYDGTQCVGCRYCMIACPFYMPGFQYDDAFDPLVMKCTFCAPRMKEGKLPGCIEACPMDALTFGKRSDLIKVARSRMRKSPGKYVDYIYGEWDAGGTAWITLAPASGTATAASANPAHDLHPLDLDTHLGNRPIGELTYGALGAVPMIVAFWPVLFGGAYAISKRRDAIHEAEKEAVAREVKNDISYVVNTAANKVAETHGPAAADTVRQAASDALKVCERPLRS